MGCDAPGKPGGIVKDDMKGFSLSSEDAWDKDDCRIRIKGQPANPENGC